MFPGVIYKQGLPGSQVVFPKYELKDFWVRFSHADLMGKVKFLEAILKTRKIPLPHIQSGLLYMKGIGVAEQEHLVISGCFEGLQKVQALGGKTGNSGVPDFSDFIFPASWQAAPDLFKEMICRDLPGLVLLTELNKLGTCRLQPEVS